MNSVLLCTLFLPHLAHSAAFCSVTDASSKTHRNIFFLTPPPGVLLSHNIPSLYLLFLRSTYWYVWECFSGLDKASAWAQLQRSTLPGGETGSHWPLGAAEHLFCGGSSLLQLENGGLFLHHTDLVSVQLLSCVWLFATLWTAARKASISITNSQSLLKFMSSKSVMPSNHLILCCLFFLLPSIFPSISVFSKESVLHIRWPKYWSFSFSISPSNEYSELISFRIGWLDLLAVQGPLKSLLQYHSSKASILQRSAFFIVQLSQYCKVISLQLK